MRIVKTFRRLRDKNINGRRNTKKTIPSRNGWLENLDEYDRLYTEPFGETGHDGKSNMVLSRDMFLSMDNETTRRNTNVCVIGGSGSGKSSAFIAPNLMQANCSFIIADPSGSLYRRYRNYLEYMGYKVKCLNLIKIRQGNCYNPFYYVHSDKDIAVLVDALVTSTNPPEAQDWDKWPSYGFRSEAALLMALVAYLHQYCPLSQQNFSNVLRLLRATQFILGFAQSNTCCSPLDALFEEARTRDPESFAVKQYDNFRMGSGREWQSVLTSCADRLRTFDIQDVAGLTETDDIDLDAVGDEKTALFVITPTKDNTFNFLASMMYTQVFLRTYDYCENTAAFSVLVMDGDNQIVRCYRADNEEQSKERMQEAEEFLEQAKKAKVIYRKELERYELVTKDGEIVAYRGLEAEAEKSLKLIREGGHVIPNSMQSNGGQRLPVHTHLLLDEFANIGRIPRLNMVMVTSRMYELSVSVVLQSFSQIKKLYRDDWPEIIYSCDTVIYLGSADTETAEWVSEILDKKTRPVADISRRKENRKDMKSYFLGQIHTMQDNECLVILKGLPPYRGLKYNAMDHPAWRLADSLGEYRFSEEKKESFVEHAASTDISMKNMRQPLRT